MITDVKYGTRAERLAITGAIPIKQLYVESDTGAVYEWRGTWFHIKPEGSTFTPSSYTGKITSTEDGTTFPIATGATKLLLQSLELTSITEFGVLAFGETEAAAKANLGKTGTTPNIISESGVIIRSGDSTLGIIPPDVLVDIPPEALFGALGNGTAADDQVIMVTQGI